VQRPDQEVENRRGEGEGDPETDAESDQRIDQPGAQLQQMLHQRRLGRFERCLVFLAGDGHFMLTAAAAQRRRRGSATGVSLLIWNSPLRGSGAASVGAAALMATSCPARCACRAVPQARSAACPVLPGAHVLEAFLEFIGHAAGLAGPAPGHVHQARQILRSTTTRATTRTIRIWLQLKKSGIGKRPGAS